MSWEKNSKSDLYGQCMVVKFIYNSIKTSSKNYSPAITDRWPNSTLFFYSTQNMEPAGL